MALRRSLGSLVGARPCSSSSLKIAVQGAVVGSAPPPTDASDALHGLRNAAVFHVDGRHSPVAAAAAALSAFSRSRGLHSRRDVDVVVQDDRGAFAALSVAVLSASLGIVYMIKDADESEEAREDDTPTETDPYFRSRQLMEELVRERASYNKTMPDNKAVVQEYMENDPAMRAKFEEWIKKHGRTYKDEVEKARRFKIFKSVAKFAEASNADAVKAGHSVGLGLNNFSDWNAEEIDRMNGLLPVMKNGGYLRMFMHYLPAQEIWHALGGQCQ